MVLTRPEREVVPPSLPGSAAAPSAPIVEEAVPTPPRWRQVLTSVRTRILVWYVVLLALALLLSILTVRSLLYVGVEDRINDELQQEVRELRSLATGTDPATSEPFGSRVGRVFDVYRQRNVPYEHEVVLTFVNGQVHRVSRFPPAAAFDDATLARWAQLDTSQRGEVETAAGTVDYLAVPLRASTGTAGVFVVAIFGDYERAQIRDAVRLLALVAFVALLVASGVAWAASGRVLAPIRLVTDTARSISESDLSRRITVKGSGEVARMANTFNRMLDRLESAFRSQRDFVNDAGHELRTPITIVRGHLELLGDNPDERRETVALVTDELDRMNRMVNDLLMLAKAQRPDFLDVEHTELATLTTELHAKAAALAPRAWKIDAHGEGAIVVDRQRITQAMIQLAQNATQHTGEDDEIALGTAVDDGQVRLWVRDTGPGVAAEDHERVFERFARVAGTPRRSEGAGLGLSIVRAIATAHGGRVTIGSRQGYGATFTLVLPVKPRHRPKTKAKARARAKAR